jgi:hypothetical protein
LVLGRRAYVCQVCNLYNPLTNITIPEVYAESKKMVEKRIREEKLELEQVQIEDVELEEAVDLSIDEFEEEEAEAPLKFEKRKVSKAGAEESEEEFTGVECPFCGEMFDDLASHIQGCEFAPEDVDLEDYLPAKAKKKRGRKAGKKAGKEEEEGKGKKKCPYCGKEFIRLGRHLKACSKRPAGAKDEEEEEEGEEGEEEVEEEEVEEEDEEEDEEEEEDEDEEEEEEVSGDDF